MYEGLTDEKVKDYKLTLTDMVTALRLQKNGRFNGEIGK